MDDMGDSSSYPDKLREFIDRIKDEESKASYYYENEIVNMFPPIHQKLIFYRPQVIGFGVPWSTLDNEQIREKKKVYGRQLFKRIQEINSNHVGDSVTKRSWDFEEVCERCRTIRDGCEILFVDACFIIELILKYANRALIEENDHIFVRGQTLQKTIRDMFVLTNQLPFKILKEVFDLTNSENSLVESVVVTMEQELCLGPIYVDGNHNYEDVNVKHLVAFVRDIWVHSSEFGRATRVEINQKSGWQQVIGNASELQRAGIRFKGVKKPTFDLKFANGTLEIPVLSITPETECFLQNVIAYEQLSKGDKLVVVSDYCVIMDCLIQSPHDVQLLRECGVINSYMHDDKDVVELFDNVGKRTPSSAYFSYSDLFDDVNKHCVGKWNSWKAKFRRNYFKDDNQLEAASFMFALYIILPVTVLQTLYTILSYYKG